MALLGQGGIGKTQVALQFAHWVKKHVPGCSAFWAPALSFESYEQACSQILKRLGIHPNADHSSMEMVCEYLSSDAAGRWLLIVDNADDPNLLFNKLWEYLPNSESGRVLLTTRPREVALSFAGMDTLELREMTEEEASTFLAKVMRKDCLVDEESTVQLLSELHYSPLAITQAAFYMNRVGISTSRYLKLMRNTEKDRANLASRDFHDGTRYPQMPNAVATSWFISFDQIKNSEPRAAELLGHLSYIEPKAIPRSLLPPLESEEELESAIGTLCGYAFLTKRDDDNVFDMHRLVQLSTRLWLEKEGHGRQIIETVMHRMEECFPSDEHTNREIWRAYLPHALQLIQRSERKDIRESYPLLSKVGSCVLADGRARDAVGYFEEVAAWNEFQHELARAHLFNGQIKQAVELLEHVVAVEGETLGEDDPSRLASQHELAEAYKSNGKIERAVNLLEYVVAVEGGTLGDENPNRLASQHGLAQVYRSNGQIKQAVELLDHVVTIKMKTLSEDQPDRLASQHELAGAYKSDGQIERAMEILEHVVEVRGRTLDEEHPDRLASEPGLAVAFLSDEQILQAVELLERVVAVESRTRHEDSISRLESQYELAIAYRSNGQTKHAVELLEHVVAIEEMILDEEDPNRLASQHELAMAYRSNGQTEQSEELLEQILAIEGRKSDEEGPDRLESQHEFTDAKQLSIKKRRNEGRERANDRLDHEEKKRKKNRRSCTLLKEVKG
ncbi:hypothetical protein N7523_006666 [Penicillium sp. IBT 18751x]|nr:hypothetical protein N7523_006666 [Penicillium sp. IBT 18751x]